MTTTMMNTNSIAAVLSSRTLLDGPSSASETVPVAARPDTIVACDDDESLRDAMQKLIDHDIYAMPVYSRSTKECIGLVGLLEIVKHLADLHWDHLQEPKPNREASIYVDFGTTPVSTVVSSRQQRVSASSTYLTVAQAMVASDGVRRIAVMDTMPVESTPTNTVPTTTTASSRVIHIVSETEIVELLYKQGVQGQDPALPRIDPTILAQPIQILSLMQRHLAGKTETDLFTTTTTETTDASAEGDMTKTIATRTDSKIDMVSQYGVVAVNGIAKAIEAFRVMVSTNATAVPIIDFNHVVTASISISDIRRVASDAMQVGVLYDETCDVFAYRTRVARVHARGSSVGLALASVSRMSSQAELASTLSRMSSHAALMTTSPRDSIVNPAITGKDTDTDTDTESVVPPAFIQLGESIATAIQRMHLNRMHRVWVVDSKRRLIGVVTLRDILRDLLTI